MRTFRQALDCIGIPGKVFVAELKPGLSSAAHVADGMFEVPRCSSPAFVPAMTDLCAREGVRLVVPTIDPELEILAEHSDELRRVGALVAVSHPDTARIGTDKALTHEWLKREGFPTVEQRTARSVLEDPAGWPFPTIAKPCRGSASIGVRVVRDPAELEIWTRGGEYIVQTLATGNEYTVDVFADRSGKVRCAVPRRRIEVRAGEVSKSVTVRSEIIARTASALCERLPGPFGMLSVQMFLDDTTGRVNVIEINPRVGGGYPLSWEAGARYSEWLIQEALGLPSAARADAWREGVVMLRFDESVFVSAESVGL